MMGNPDLNQRLEGLERLLSSQGLLMHERNLTGFMSILLPYSWEFMRTVAAVDRKYRSEDFVFLDPSCGNAGPGLMMAAAGIASYNIDINGALVELAHENYRRAVAEGLIDCRVEFRAVQGNMFSPDWNTRVTQYNAHAMPSLRKDPITQKPADYTLPVAHGRDPYPSLGISFSDANLLYMWPWEEGIQIYLEYMKSKSPEGTRLIFPHFWRRGANPSAVLQDANRRYGSNLSLECFEADAMPIFRLEDA